MSVYFTTKNFAYLSKTPFEIEELYPIYQKYNTSFIEGSKLYGSSPIKRLPQSIFIALYVIFNTIDENFTAEFFDGINKGVALSQGSPLLALRSGLENCIYLQHERRNPLAASLAIQAWNACMKGEQRKILRNIQPVPEIYGFNKTAFLDGIDIKFPAGPITLLGSHV